MKEEFKKLLAALFEVILTSVLLYLSIKVILLHSIYGIQPSNIAVLTIQIIFTYKIISVYRNND